MPANQDSLETRQRWAREERARYVREMVDNCQTVKRALRHARVHAKVSPVDFDGGDGGVLVKILPCSVVIVGVIDG